MQKSCLQRCSSKGTIWVCLKMGYAQKCQFHVDIWWELMGLSCTPIFRETQTMEDLGLRRWYRVWMNKVKLQRAWCWMWAASRLLVDTYLVAAGVKERDKCHHLPPPAPIRIHMFFTHRLPPGCVAFVSTGTRGFPQVRFIFWFHQRKRLQILVASTCS